MANRNNYSTCDLSGLLPAGDRMKGHYPIPKNWTGCQIEIDRLLRSFYPDYEERIYLKPVYYISRIKDHPEQYPFLSQLVPQFQKRHISLFLQQQGRVMRAGSKMNAHTWMLPEAVI